MDPNQVEGSIMNGIREQNPQDFYKFGDFKTMKLLSNGHDMINLNIIFHLFKILFSQGAQLVINGSSNIPSISLSPKLADAKLAHSRLLNPLPD